MSESERKNFLGSGNDPFICENCGADIAPLSGSFRNHCPECLWSLHVDIVPGDRKNPCRGLMEPIRVEGAEGSGWYVVHRCVECGEESRNHCALTAEVQPDSWEVLIEISRSSPPPKG